MMRKLLFVLITLSLLLFTGCLLVPSTELPATVPPHELADRDSRFIDVRGLNLHYKKSGGGEPTFLLLHGFGASVFTWRDVMAQIAIRGTVLAYDRPAFGLTERPIEWQEWNPYSSSAQVGIALALLDEHKVRNAILVGNSAGGTVAAQIASQAPDRVAALVLISPAIYQGGGPPNWARSLLRWPPLKSLGLRFIRSSFQDAGNSLAELAWHDPSRLDDETMAGYELPLRADNWDLGLWNFVVSSDRPSDLATALSETNIPVLIVTGDDDRVIPTSDSIRLAEEINARLDVFEACGHVPQEECPDQFMKSLNNFVDELQNHESSEQTAQLDAPKTGF